MARNINAEVLTKGIEQQFCNVCSGPEIGKCKACDIAEILNMIDDTPTVEAESTDKTAVFQPFDKSDFDYLAERGMPIFKCTCSECGDMCFGDENFCSGCGAKIKWDEKRN